MGRAPDYIGALYGGGPDAPEAMWAFLCNYWSWRIAKERFPPLTIQVYLPPDLNIADTTFKHETFAITVNATLAAVSYLPRPPTATCKLTSAHPARTASLWLQQETHGR